MARTFQILHHAGLRILGTLQRDHRPYFLITRVAKSRGRDYLSLLHCQVLPRACQVAGQDCTELSDFSGPGRHRKLNPCMDEGLSFEKGNYLSSALPLELPETSV